MRKVKEERMSKLKQPIAIYYEHPHWFVPLFNELDRRGVPYVRIDAAQHHFDPSQLNGEGGYSLVFNRMSPSAYRRGHGQAIFYTLYYLDHLEQRGKRIVNGQKAFRYETSKALQLSLLEALRFPYPKSRVINNPADAVGASKGLRFPIVVKPNIGGSGAGEHKYSLFANQTAEIDKGFVVLRSGCRRLATFDIGSKWMHCGDRRQEGRHDFVREGGMHDEIGKLRGDVGDLLLDRLAADAP